jgi:hypothetical protein
MECGDAHPTLRKPYEWNGVVSDGLCRNVVNAIEEKDVESSQGGQNMTSSISEEINNQFGESRSGMLLIGWDHSFGSGTWNAMLYRGSSWFCNPGGSSRETMSSTSKFHVTYMVHSAIPGHLQATREPPCQ